MHLARFYGVYSIIISCVILICQFLFTSQIIRVLGVAKSLMVQPLTSILGLVTIMSSMTLYAGFFMKFAWDFIWDVDSR